MTTYSKLCPKCQHPCDMSAPSCKRCGLRFGAAGAEAATRKPARASFSRPAAVVLALFGLLALVLVMQIVGASREKARRQKEIDYNSWENVQRRMNSGQ